MYENADHPLFESMKKIPLQKASVFQEPEDLMKKYEGVLQHLKFLESENLELKRTSLMKPNEIPRNHERLELENLKLLENIHYLEELYENSLQEKEKIKKIILEKDEIIKQNRTKEDIFNKELQMLQQNNKKLVEQLKISNENFTTANQKATFHEKENKLLNEKLNNINKDRRSLSIKWQKASEKNKKENELNEKIKKLESTIVQKNKESTEYREKYVNASLELRVLRESQQLYKEKVENQINQISKKDLKTTDIESIPKKEEFETKIPPKLEELLKENGELFKNLNDCMFSLQISQEKISFLEEKLNKSNIEIEILKKKGEVLNDENEKLYVSYSQLQNETKSEKMLYDSLNETSYAQQSDNFEKHIDFIKKSKEYNEFSQCIGDQSILRAKFDQLIFYIQENHPLKKELQKMKALYDRLIVKYQNQQKIVNLKHDSLENSKYTNTMKKDSNSLYNSMISMVSTKKEHDINGLALKKMQKTLGNEEEMLLPKILFKKKSQKRLNKSFNLDPNSCKKYHCKDAKDDENTSCKQKKNLTSFLTQNKPNSYIIQYLTKKNVS